MDSLERAEGSIDGMPVPQHDREICLVVHTTAKSFENGFARCVSSIASLQVIDYIPPSHTPGAMNFNDDSETSCTSRQSEPSVK